MRGDVKRTMVKRYAIEDFGARPDGILCTEAIQEAIDACAETGGIVEVGAGSFLTGTLRLRSHVTLHLSQNAVLLGSGSMADYKSFGHIQNEFGEVFSLFYAEDCEDIVIEGDGKIDFNGDAFFDYTTPRMKGLDLESLTEEQKNQYVVNFDERPNQMMFFRKCRNIRVRDTMFINAPCWGIVFSACEQVKITGITIRFGQRIPNNDGIHLCSCQDVVVSGCDIVAGDDCIAITGIDDWMKESRRIIVSDCILSSSSAGIRIGYFCSKVRDISVHNCTIHRSNRGICMMACKGGYVKNVLLSGLIIDTMSRAGGWWGVGETIYLSALDHEIHSNYREEYDRQPAGCNIENITVRDLTASCENGIVIAGQKGNIRDVRFYNARLTFIDAPNRTYFGNRMDFLPGKTEKTVPEGHLYWIYAKEASRIKVLDYMVENKTGQEDMMIEPCLEDCRDVVLEPAWG